MTFYAISRQRRANTTPLFALVALWFLILSIFHVLPAIDIDISAFFFSGPVCQPANPQIPCGYFPLATEASVQTARWVLYRLPYLAAGIVVIAIIVGNLSSALQDRMPFRRLWIALASVGLGTGLIVNGLLKEHSGRPRPIETNLFGGQMDFMPAGSFLGACNRNCSFVSGEASGAGWLICLLFLLPPRYRRWIAPPVVAASLATAFLRVAVGAHYASDALLGWLLSIVVFVGLLTLEARLSES